MKKRIFQICLVIIYFVLMTSKSQRRESLSEIIASSYNAEQFLLIDAFSDMWRPLTFSDSDEYTALYILLVGNVGHAVATNNCITIHIRQDIEDTGQLFLCDTVNKKCYYLSGKNDLIHEYGDYAIEYMYSSFKILLEKK